MGFFRRPASPPSEPDDALPMTVEQARVLVPLARQAFAEQGVETLYDGEGALQAAHGAYGLYNLAAQCLQEPRRRWRRLADRHATALIAAERAGNGGLDEVRDRLRIRVLADDDLRQPPDYGLRLADDLIGLLAVDNAEHVRVYQRRDAFAELGDFDELLTPALANLRRSRARQHETVRVDEDDPTSDVHVLAGDFFTASRIVVLDDVLRDELGIERPRHGVLIAVPNRNVLAVHPLSGGGVVPALTFLVHLARGEHDAAPGALSPDVYFAKDGRVERVTSPGDDGSVIVSVEGRLGEAFAALGLGDY
jgi:hypothetical protein